MCGKRVCLFALKRLHFQKQFVRGFFGISPQSPRQNPVQTRRRQEGDPNLILTSPPKKIDEKLLSEKHKSVDFEKIFHSLWIDCEMELLRGCTLQNLGGELRLQQMPARRRRACLRSVVKSGSRCVLEAIIERFQNCQANVSWQTLRQLWFPINHFNISDFIEAEMNGINCFLF